MRIFFDVDDTLIAWDGSLRPYTRETFHRLLADGHTLYLWSGAGIRTEIVERHGLQGFIADCFVKPTFDYANRLAQLGVPFRPDFCIDDHSGIVRAFGGVWISPYLLSSKADEEMKRVYEEVRQFVAGRHGTQSSGSRGAGVNGRDRDSASSMRFRPSNSASLSDEEGPSCDGNRGRGTGS